MTDKGLQPDPDKVKAVNSTPIPEDATSLRRYLGFLQYLAKFLPRLADTAAPLFELTKKDVPYHWQQQHQAAFEATKRLATAKPILRYYDPRADLEIECDASDTGLGATLMQQGQPIAYGSRVLTPTERRYAPIEKEMLAIVWAMEKYHQYTYGNRTTVFSDHKPLENIMGKALKDVPKRLQNMRIRLQHYHVKVEYKPGPTQHVADYLSRLHPPGLQDSPPDSDCIEAIEVNEVSHVLIGETWRQRLIEHTASDATLQALRDQVTVGWPERQDQLAAALKTYHAFHEELAYADGLLFRGERVIVPACLRRDLMKEVHSAHMGVQSCLRRARECLYWPRMNAELKDFISRCDICQRYGAAQLREPMLPVELPDRPWQMVSCDLFHWKNAEYLITVDHYSNFFEVDKLSNPTTQQVTGKLSSHIARYGQPEVLISDNGPQFSSAEFSRFVARWDVQHKTSSPHHQQGNGRAEAAVKIAKSLMTKADNDRQDPYKALLAYRNTPQEGLGSSPAQRFLGRRTRTSLPLTGTMLQPQPVESVPLELKQRQETVKEKYDRHARPLQPLEEGQSVRIKPANPSSKVWAPGAVEKELDNRSYLVRTPDDTVYRRNRIDLRAVPEPAPQNPPESHHSEPIASTAASPNVSQTQEALDRRPQRIRSRPAYLDDYDCE